MAGKAQRRHARLIALLAVLAACLAAAPSASAATPKLKKCGSKNLMAGPFFASKLRARVVGCSTARKFVRRWGNTSDCVMPVGGPSDDVCRVGRYRCVTRSIAYEQSRASCKRKGTRRAVGFNFGS